MLQPTTTARATNATTSHRSSRRPTRWPTLCAGPNLNLLIRRKKATTAKRTTLREGLSDLSGVTATSIDGKPYLLVNESQLGFAFGIDQGGPQLPYRIDVIER